MLDLLQAIEDEGGARVPVQAEPPQFGQQPGVRCVPAVDRQLDRGTGRIMAGELLDSPHLVRGPGHARDGDFQVRDPLGDLGRCRQAQR